MDSIAIASNNYSNVVGQYNKIYKVNQNLKKENKDLHAQKHYLLKAFEKLKSLRGNRKQNDSRTMHIKNNDKISKLSICNNSDLAICEDNQYCCSVSSNISESNEADSNVQQLSEISNETYISDCDFLSKLMSDVDLCCNTKIGCDHHVKLIKKLQTSLIYAMQLDESNETYLDRQQNEINYYVKQLDDEKEKSEHMNSVISEIKEDTSKLAYALEDQYLKNKSLKSCNLENQQILECKLSKLDAQCYDLTMYNTEIENNLKRLNIDNCEKTDIILYLQEQLNDSHSKIEEFNFQLSLSANEISESIDRDRELKETIKKMHFDNGIMKIELKSLNLQLKISKDFSNIKIDENQILFREIESLTNSVNSLKQALENSESENISLVEKSIGYGLDALCSLNKMNILEHGIKHCEEYINELNNLNECAMARESNTQKELDLCNSKLHIQMEDNRDLQFQLMETRKNSDEVCEKLIEFQQLQNTMDELNKEKIKNENVIVVNKNEIKYPSMKKEIVIQEAKLIDSLDIEIGQIPIINEKYMEKELLQTITNVEEIIQVSLKADSEIHVHPEEKRSMDIKTLSKHSKVSSTSSQKSISKTVSLLSIHKPESHSKSNVSIQRNSKSSKSNGDTSDLYCTSGCSCTGDSNQSTCDCIIKYLKNSDKQPPNELDAMKRKLKQYKMRIRELEASEKLQQQQYCASNFSSSASNKSQDQKLADDYKKFLEAAEEKKLVLVQQKSIKPTETLPSKLKKRKTQKTKKPKSKIMDKMESAKPEIKYNFPCTACKDKDCHYNKTAPKTQAEWKILFQQVNKRWT